MKKIINALQNLIFADYRLIWSERQLNGIVNKR